MIPAPISKPISWVGSTIRQYNFHPPIHNQQAEKLPITIPRSAAATRSIVFTSLATAVPHPNQSSPRSGSGNSPCITLLNRNAVADLAVGGGTVERLNIGQSPGSYECYTM